MSFAETMIFGMAEGGGVCECGGGREGVAMGRSTMPFWSHTTQNLQA